MDLQTLSFPLLCSGLLFFTFWLLSLKLNNAGIVDVIWGLSFVVLAWASAWQLDSLNIEQVLLLMMVTTWGTRLGVHIGLRNLGKPEDYRYQNIRKRLSPGFAFKSLVYVFGLQFVLSAVIASPIFWVFSKQYSADVPSTWAVLAMIIWTIGFYFEVAGDYQLQQFKKKPENKGQLLTTGLWSLTRHPNYFGDGLLWWGFYCMALPSHGYITIVGPIIMNLFLRRVSGVDLLEKRLKKVKPGFEDYMKSTPAFVPSFRKLLSRSTGPSDNEDFLRLIQLAKEDEDLKSWLVSLAEMEDFDRHSVIQGKVDELNLKEAPQEHIHIFKCLMEQKIIEKLRGILKSSS